MCEIEKNEEFVRIKGFKAVEYLCDSCKIGKMLPTNIVLACEPPLYQHKCTYCEEIKSFLYVYPRTVVIIE